MDQLDLIETSDVRRNLAVLEQHWSPSERWTPPGEFPRLWEAPRVAIDVETRDGKLKERGPGWAFGEDDSYIVGVGVASDDWSGYFPLRHEGGGNVENHKTVFRWLRKIAGSTKTQKVFFNQNYDVPWLEEEGVTFRGELRDASIAVPMLDENRRPGQYDLDSICQDWIGVGKDETDLRSFAALAGIKGEQAIKENLWRFPGNVVGPYGQRDPEVTLKLWDYCEPLLREQDLWELFLMEQALLPVLAKMRRKGIPIDEERAYQLAKDLDRAHKEEIRWIDKDFGVGEISVKSPQDLVRCCQKLNLHYEEIEETGNPSFVADWIEAQDHPFWKRVKTARDMQTLHSMVQGQILDQIHNGRIHGQLHSMKGEKGGTVTGRLSASTPNLQNVPTRDPEWGPKFRSLFIPEEGKEWLKADYSQQEYRLIVHYALLLKLPGAEEAAELYRKAEADFHAIVAKMMGIPRTPAKNLNFGMAYTMGADKLALKLGVPLEEAQRIIALYHERVPFVRGLTNACSNKAQRAGYIRTILKRRGHFPLWEPSWTKNNAKENIWPLPWKEARSKWPNTPLKRGFVYRAMNKLIQGSAADMTKKAMLNVAEAGYLPCLQVHDELDWSDIEPGDDASCEEIAEIMDNAIPLKIPCPVEWTRSTNWGNIALAA